MSFTSTEGSVGTVLPAAADVPRWGDVYIAATARAISVCGDFLAATALLLALQSRGAGGIAVSAVLLASTVPLGLFGSLAGRLADRVDSRYLLVAVGSAQAIVCAVLAHANHPVAIVLLVAVLATGLAVSSPTLSALVPEMVGIANVPRASAISQTGGAVGLLVGPAFAGVLVGQFGLRVPLLIDAVSYLALVVAALAIRTRRGGRAAAHPAPAGPPAPGWRLRRDSLLFAVVAGAAVAIAAISAVNVADVFFVRETLHGSPTAYGLLLAVWTGAMLVGSWLAVKLARARTDGGLGALLVGLFGATSMVLVAAAGVPTVAWLVPLWVVGGIFNGGENVLANVLVAHRVPAQVRGRAMGVVNSAVNGANVVGYALGGVLLTAFAPRPIIAGAGLAGLAVALACLVPIRRAAGASAAADPATGPAPARGSSPV